MNRLLNIILIYLPFLLLSNFSFGCHLVSISETAAVDNGDGTYSYTFDVCVGTENTYGFYLNFTGANLISYPATVTGPSTGVTISASVPPISLVGDIEYGDWDNSFAPIYSGFNPDCVSMTFTFDAPITDATLGGTQIVFLPPAGCTPVTTQTTACFSPSYVVTINTDNYGAESTWNFVDQTTGVIVASGGPYSNNSTSVENVCLAAGCYDFVMLDAFGDGMCCAYGIGSYSVVDNTASVVASGGSFGFSQTTPLPCVVLSINLLSFDVSEGTDYQNQITWVVASQENNDYFEIQRSQDLENWEVLEYIKGAGTTDQEISYEIQDNSFDELVNYYRLIQVDFDGTTEAFAPKSIDNRVNSVKLVARSNYLGQEVDASYSGLVIERYSDGTINRTYQK